MCFSSSALLMPQRSSSTPESGHQSHAPSWALWAETALRRPLQPLIDFLAQSHLQIREQHLIGAAQADRLLAGVSASVKSDAKCPRCLALHFWI
jgi:hypothetical protein